MRLEKGIDKIFYWSGNSRILLTIVKLVEDEKNLEADVRQGVQVILVVEDSPFYSSLLLPIIYAEILHQTRYLISHAVNELHRLLRMRARPKIVLVDSLEAAEAFYEQHSQNLLGIISDVSFPAVFQKSKQGRCRWNPWISASTKF